MSMKKSAGQMRLRIWFSPALSNVLRKHVVERTEDNVMQNK